MVGYFLNNVLERIWKEFSWRSQGTVGNLSGGSEKGHENRVLRVRARVRTGNFPNTARLDRSLFLQHPAR